MKARTLMMAFAGLAVVALVAFAEDKGEKKDKGPLKGAKCPVSGKAAKDIDGSSLTHKDGKVYFCCANCPKAYAKNTAKYAAKANHQLVLTGQYEQTKCPLTGRPMNKAKTNKIAGVSVSVCCGNCDKKVKGAADDVAKGELLFNDKVFAKGFAKKKAKKDS